MREKLKRTKTQLLFYLLTYLVVDVAVGEHCVEVLYALTCTAIEVVLQALFDGPHVHGLFDNFMVILKKVEC